MKEYNMNYKKTIALFLLSAPFIIACGSSTNSSIPSLNLPSLEKVSLSSIQFDGNMISWEEVQDAIGYEIKINDNAFVSTTRSNEFTFSSPATFEVQIKALGDLISFSNSFSDTKRFEKLPDIVTSSFTYDFPNVTWSYSSSVTGFDYELKLNGLIQPKEFVDETILSGFETRERYELRVKPLKDSTLSNIEYFSSYSNWVEFEFLESVEATFNKNLNRVEWAPINYALQYEIKISFNNELIDTRLTSEAFYSFSQEIGGDYTIEIKALASLNSTYKTSPKSNYTLTKLDAPSIDRIEDLLNDGGSRIYFSEIEHAESFQVSIDSNSVSASFDGSSSQYYIDFGFGIDRTMSSTYSLQAVSESSLPWHMTSTTFSQNLVQIARPSNVRLIDNVLRWDGVSSSQGYIVTIGQFTPIIIMNPTITEVDFLSNIDLDAGSYSIRIQSRGNGMNSVSSFFTSSVNFSRLASPSNISILQGEMTWQAVPQASKYLIDYSSGHQVEVLTNSHTINVDFIDNDTIISVSAMGDGVTLLGSRSSDTEKLNRLDAVQLAPSSITSSGIEWDENALTSNYQIIVEYSSEVIKIDTDDSNWDWNYLEVESGDFVLSVVAKGDGTTFFDSLPSNPLELTRLSKPQLTASGSDLQFEWSHIQGSSGYLLQIPSRDSIFLSSQTVSYETTFTQSGSYEISITALSNGYPTVSSKTDIYVHQVIQLATPSGSPVMTFSQNLQFLTATISTPIDNAHGYRFFVGDTYFETTDTSTILSYSLVSGNQNFSVMALGNGFTYLNSNQSALISRLVLSAPALTITPVNASFIQLNWTQVSSSASYYTLISKKSLDGTVTQSPPISSANDVFSILIGISGFVEVTITHYAIGNGLSNFSSSPTTLIYSI
jgi:hypothetical protein